MNEDDRYARQKLIEWWDQDRLRSARVLVAGAGALGNEVLKNLALLGVGHLLIIDSDHVEPSNLSRTVLFDEKHVGCSKASVAACALRRLSPHAGIQSIHGDLFYDVGLGYYRHSDLAIGCLDNLAARSQLGHDCALAGIPHLDGGMWSLGGEVRWFMAGDGPCFHCTLSDEDHQRAGERRSCSGFLDPAGQNCERMPTVVSTAAVIGGILAQEAAKRLCGHPIAAGKAIVYNGQTLTMHRSRLESDPRCFSPHYPYEDVVQLPFGAAALTARRLFDLARIHLEGNVNPSTDPAETGGHRNSAEMTLELGRDFLLGFHCSVCERMEAVNEPTGKVWENRRRCPRCGSIRRSEEIHAVHENGVHSDLLLSRLGIPPGEVVAVRVSGRMLLFELTGDVQQCR